MLSLAWGHRQSVPEGVGWVPPLVEAHIVQCVRTGELQCHSCSSSFVIGT